MSVKRLKIVLLLLFVLIGGFPLYPIQQSDAGPLPAITKEYDTGAWFEDGKLVYVTPNKKASSSIQYGTKAFIIRLDETCTDKKSSVQDPLGAECTPASGTLNNDYLRIDLYNAGGDRNTTMWDVSDIGECDYLHNWLLKRDGINISAKELWQQNRCEQDIYGSSASESVLVAIFKSKKEDFTLKLVNSPNPKFQNIKNGTTVYMSSVFLIKTNGKPAMFPEYTTLSGIRNAKSWANKLYFRNYYDIPVEYKGSFPITVKYVMEADQTKAVPGKADTQIKSTYGLSGKDGYEPNMWPAWGYSKAETLDGQGIKLLDKIEGSDKKTYFLQCSYITRSMEPVTRKCTSETSEPEWVRFGSTLTERQPAVYVGGTDVIAVYTDDPDCNCFTTATIPNKAKIEGEVPADNTTIGQKVTMQVDLQQKDQSSIEDWEKWVTDKTNFKIRVRTYRTDQTNVLTGLANTGDLAIWSTTSKLLPADDANPNRETPVTKEELLAYLKGGSTSKVLYYDDLTNYPIPEGGKVSFRYNADVFISATDKSGKVVTKQCNRSDSTALTWFRPEKPKANIGSFFSVPKYYSEIKEGSPQPAGTSSNETFDAMSGVPTTRSLYFASGGSEFIVDVEVEYVPQVTQTRTYKSEFKSVVNGWAMDKITGGWQNDTPPSQPTPRKMTDVCKASYTETVTQETGTYPKGSDSKGNPILGTKYRWIQNGYDSHKVGGYVDTWTQTVTFDYMKINKAIVWKIDRSRVDGLATLVGTNEVTADITQGDPNIFYNIAGSNTSAAGRLRYSLETNQHDSVYWDEGESDNCLTNSKDSGPVKEQDKFKERRELTGNVTAISDFLILQTSQGDQSVMYFQKTSNTAKATEQLDVPTTDFETMWTNNPLSAAKWNESDTIKIGSYNGQFFSPAVKYSGTSTGMVATIFDSMPAGKIRPGRPAPYLRLMTTGLDVPDTLPNGEYITGTSTVFYKNILNANPNNKPTAYPIQYDARYGATGLTFTSAYSPIHSKVNDVVIHNPVSVQNAMVISLPDSLDQRTTPPVGNKQEGVAEYERVLDPSYRQNILPNPDAEIVNVDKTVAGWNKWVATGKASDITFTSRTGDSWVIAPGAHTFEVNSAANTGTTGGYWKDIPIKPNILYQFEGDLICNQCNGYFALDVYDAGRNYAGLSIGSNDPVTNTSKAQHKTFTFTSPANAAYLRIHMVKGASSGAGAGTRDYLFADNLSLKNMSVQEFVAIDSVEVTQQVPNPDYEPPRAGDHITFNYTGNVQTFTAPYDGVYTIEVWGAQGGTGCQKGCSGRGGYGGYSKGDITLTEGETLNIYVGGQGGYNGAAGWNGGGRADSSNGGGGGASDVRIGGTALGNRIIVAGGGGGGGSGATGGAGGGLAGGTGTSTSEVGGGSGGSQTSGYSLGSGGSVSGDGSAGGGGYYGGNGSQTHGCEAPNAGGGGGSGYIGGVANGTMSTGVNSGHGRIVIQSPPREAVGLPTRTITTTAGGSDTSPPSDAYILNPVTVNPNVPAGGYTPGNFILLDYAFQLYYPNTGDFYGNGQWGWAQTTEMRGKGFVNDMDTTEWTKAKYVKFDINVIYDNTMYLANEWIQLPVTSPGWLYDFYVPLANREKVSAMVEWKSIAINASFEDGDTPANKVRYSTPRPYAAKHTTLKKYQVDVVGRIGNLVIEDTGDFRFSNLFKQPLMPKEWYVPNVVPKVNPNVQNKIVGDRVNIRGDAVTAGTKYLNTWGLLGHMEQDPIPLPLSSEKNNIPALLNQPLRIGYDVLADIQTYGNYYSRLQITPYYYYLNLKNGAITPVDVYMDVDGQYKLINRHDGVYPGWNPASVHANLVRLDWDSQASRRNVRTIEGDLTTRIAALFAESGGDSATGKAAEPSGNYTYGTSQFMDLTGRNRTYIGQDSTYGVNRNPGNRLSVLEYAMQAQRWHFSNVLPSSAAVVNQGQQPTQANINALRNNTGVILLAADIKAVGDTYTLQYESPVGNGMLNVAGTSWSLAGIPHPVIAVYSAFKSSADDLSLSGTH